MADDTTRSSALLRYSINSPQLARPSHNVTLENHPYFHTPAFRDSAVCPRFPLTFRRWRALAAAPHQLMKGERDFIRMRRAPRNNALELDGFVDDGADFH